MSLFREALADLTSAGFEHFGDAAAYTPAGGGASVPCTVIVRSTDVLAGLAELQTVAGDATIEVSAAQIPDAPQTDALFVVGDETWRVVDTARRREDDRQVWTVDVELVTP